MTGPRYTKYIERKFVDRTVEIYCTVQRVHLYVKGYIISVRPDELWKMYTYIGGRLLYVFEKSKCVPTENRTKNSFFLSLHFSCPLALRLFKNFWVTCFLRFSCVNACMHARTVSWNNLTQLKGTVWRDFCTPFFALPLLSRFMCKWGVVSTYCQVLLELNWKPLLLSIFETGNKVRLLLLLKGIF
jgi:hypothetical protein